MTDNEIIKALENCYLPITKKALDLINRQKAEIEKLEKVEHFADKTIATQQAEIERLQKDGETLAISLLNAKAEIERLQKQLNNAEDLVAEKTVDITDLLGEIENYKHLDVILNTAIDKLAKDLKAEAYKEFAERFLNSYVYGDSLDEEGYRYAERLVNNLVKEMVGDADEMRT